MGLLNKVSITDVPENRAERLSVVGTIGSVQQKQAANGYVAITVPIAFETAAGDEREFTARFNIKPEWLEITSKEEIDALEDKERTSYQINLQKLTRGLFKAVGASDIDFDALEGERVGFTANPRSDDPSRLQISSFYTPRS